MGREGSQAAGAHAGRGGLDPPVNRPSSPSPPRDSHPPYLTMRAPPSRLFRNGNPKNFCGILFGGGLSATLGFGTVASQEPCSMLLNERLYTVRR